MATTVSPLMTIKKSNIYVCELIFTYVENDTPYDLTNKTVYFSAKYRKDYIKSNGDDAVAIINKTISVHTFPTSGRTNLVLTSEDTNVDKGYYVYDLKIYGSGVDVNTEPGTCIVGDIITTIV